MNIFYLHHDPVICAEMHNDKHCVKMIIEYAQLLSTAHRLLDGDPYIDKTANGRSIKRWRLEDELDEAFMKASHINHPSNVWARENDSNYTWLFALWKALCSEYTYRYGKIHSVERRMLNILIKLPKNIKHGAFTEPTPAMPDDVKVTGNSIASYRSYYINNKTHLAKWKNRPTPQWFTEGCLQKMVDINQELGLYA